MANDDCKTCRFSKITDLPPVYGKKVQCIRLHRRYWKGCAREEYAKYLDANECPHRQSEPFWQQWLIPILVLLGIAFAIYLFVEYNRYYPPALPEWDDGIGPDLDRGPEDWGYPYP